MIKGATKSGFKYEILEERLENYELIEALSEVDENPMLLPKTVNLLLGKKQADKLKEHLRDDKGLISTNALSNEIVEIFENQKKTKNS